MSKPTVGYWNIRGLGQSIRHMLTYVGVEFEDVHYQLGKATSFNDYLKGSTWEPVKSTLDLDFPNLPYYIDGDVKMTQSNAIMRHLARKYGLDGKTEEEKIRIDIVKGVHWDVFICFAQICYTNLEEGREGFIATLPEKLKLFSDYLGARPWFAGNEITVIDFDMYELLRLLNKFSGESVEEFENLVIYLRRFEELPTISEYMNKPDYIHKPFFLNFAQFKE